MSVIVYCHEICGGDSRLNNLDEVFTSFCRSPLHTAVIQGDTRLAEKIISKRPDLALKEDRQGFTPLHLASARESLPMVKLLLKAKTDACMVRDKDGKTPLHIAAAKDRVEIMKLLMVQRPGAINLKNDRNGETILHFCVKSNSSVETLELLVSKLGLAQTNPDTISVDSKDDDGNTVLHLAAEMRKFKIVNYLLQSNNIRIDMDVVNNKGQKALDMLSQAERNDLETGMYDYLGHTKEHTEETSSGNKDDDKHKKSPKKRNHKERVNALLVVATLIAQIAFQAALNPPGGVWQEDSTIDSGAEPIKFSYYFSRMFGNNVSDELDFNPQGNLTTTDPIQVATFMLDLLDNTLFNSPNLTESTRKGVILQDYTGPVISRYNNSSYGGGNFFPYIIRYAGFPIMAYKTPTMYVVYMLVNTMAFSLSLTIVFAVICGFVHDKSVAQNRILVMLMCFSIGCISIGYLLVFESFVPDFFTDGKVSNALAVYFGVCCICGIGLLLWHFPSRMVKLHKRHLSGINFFKALFSMDASAVGKVALLIMGLCLFWVTYEGLFF